MGGQIVNNRKIIGPQNEQNNRKIIVPDGQKNNRNDGDVGISKNIRYRIAVEK